VDRVAAALEGSVAPLIIARGGAVRVLAIEDGTATIEASGSPGAFVPVWSRVEAAVRAAVSEVTGLRLVVPGGMAPPSSPPEHLVERIRRVLDEDVSPAIAAHRGRVTLVGVDSDWVSIRLEGGCQGCSLAAVTVRQGIEPILRARIPEIVGLVDVTDHEAGTEPFFAPTKR
jgi:Fe-S cluster biogenesis protein NfuA